MTNLFEALFWAIVALGGVVIILWRVWRIWRWSEERRHEAEARQRQRLEAAMRLSGPPAAPGYPHRRVSK